MEKGRPMRRWLDSLGTDFREKATLGEEADDRVAWW